MSNAKDVGTIKSNLTQMSVVLYFLVGGALLVSPVLFVSSWNPQQCSSDSIGQSKCSASLIYSKTLSFLPFVMLIGGVLIGYNMKRISDSLHPNDEKDSEEEESKKWNP